MSLVPRRNFGTYTENFVHPPLYNYRPSTAKRDMSCKNKRILLGLTGDADLT